jgi:Ftsk gamma domain
MEDDTALEAAYEALFSSVKGDGGALCHGGTMLIQKRLQCGYNRAASLMSNMEERGWITEADDHGRRRFTRQVEADGHSQSREIQRLRATLMLIEETILSLRNRCEDQEQRREFEDLIVTIDRAYEAEA